MNAPAQMKRKSRPREHQVSAARSAAFEILRRVEEEGAYAAPLLATATGELRSEDRALCYELVLGTLRWQLWLDCLINHYANRSADSLDPPIRRALRLGLYQMRLLARVPVSAAINESVNLAHAARLQSATGFINAVLRRATREPEYDPAEGITREAERIAVRTSHPLWMIERWLAAFGADETEAFAQANNQTPPKAFRINTLRAEAAEVTGRLNQTGVVVQPSRVAPDAWRVEGAGRAELLRSLAAEGVVYMQDEASQLVAQVLGAYAGERILDVCAAPGGKTTHLATLAADKALVIAGDIHTHRLRTVREAAARQKLGSIRAVAYDGKAALPFAEKSFDRVLVDAPCTGTGTLRHNPEIRWRISSFDIEELAARQQRILVNASQTVRRGGRLVYSTCSVEREENEAVVAAFLDAHADFRQVPAWPDTASWLTPSGAVRTWPHKDGVDGFFMVAFTREN